MEKENDLILPSPTFNDMNLQGDNINLENLQGQDLYSIINKESVDFPPNKIQNPPNNFKNHKTT